MRTFIDVSTTGGGQFLPIQNLEKKTKVPLMQHEQRLIIATCEKGTVEDVNDMKGIKAGLDTVKDANPNFVDIAAHDTFRFRSTKDVSDPIPSSGWLTSAKTKERIARMQNRKNVRIGIPRLLNVYTYAPVFNGYLQSLGVPSENIVYSDYTSGELYRLGSTRGAIDPCFQAKIGIAHVNNQIAIKRARKQFNVIFFPMFDVLTSPPGEDYGLERLPHCDGDARNR